MTVQEIIAKVKQLETAKSEAMEKQSLAGKEARAVQKQIDGLNQDMMKAVMAEQAQATQPAEIAKKQK